MDHLDGNVLAGPGTGLFANMRGLRWQRVADQAATTLFKTNSVTSPRWVRSPYSARGRTGTALGSSRAARAGGTAAAERVCDSNGDGD